MTSPRRAARGIAGFTFGIASTVLLVGMWGRAVVVDTGQLEESLAPLASSTWVTSRFSSWLVGELEEAGADPVAADTAADEALDTPEVESAMSDILTEVIAAAALPTGAEATVDARGALAPAVPAITQSLNSAGIPATEDRVAATVAGLDPLVVRQESEPPLVGRDSEVASKLGTAAVLGLSLILISGTAYVLVSIDRRKAMRTLLTRFALGALSFAVMLRIGGWILDPAGGRAPVEATLGNVALSKWMVPLGLGAAAAVASTLFWTRRRRRVRPAAASRSEPEGSTPPAT